MGLVEDEDENEDEFSSEASLQTGMKRFPNTLHTSALTGGSEPNHRGSAQQPSGRMPSGADRRRRPTRNRSMLRAISAGAFARARVPREVAFPGTAARPAAEAGVSPDSQGVSPLFRPCGSAFRSSVIVERIVIGASRLQGFASN